MNYADKIDHTILKADATTAMVERYCEETIKYGFASVCVNTCHVPVVAQRLKGTSVRVCCVVGFPLGAMMTEAKAWETKLAVEAGAQEVDMVINIGALKDQNYAFVEQDIKAVVAAAKNATVKVILETCLLTEEEIVHACQLAIGAGATFVKTSTGFSTGGARTEDIVLMKKTVGTRAQIKASGGILTREDALAMLAAGADRIGTGNGVGLL